MEEQGKINVPGLDLPEESITMETQKANNSEDTATSANPPNAVTGNGQQPYSPMPQTPNPQASQQRMPQYGGYNPNMAGNGYQMPYNGYSQPQYAQGQFAQGGYRPNVGYPAQNMAQNQRPYGGYQQNAAGTGPGEYNYKARMNQYNQNGSYNGAGPGQYDYRTGQQSSQTQQAQSPQQAQPQQPQYGYNNNYQQGQYPYKPQTNGGYGYYQPQQYGYPQYGQQMQNPQQYGGYNPQFGYNNQYNMYGQRPAGMPMQGGYMNPQNPQQYRNPSEQNQQINPQTTAQKTSEPEKIEEAVEEKKNIVEETKSAEAVVTAEATAAEQTNPHNEGEQTPVENGEQSTGTVKKKIIVKKIIKTPIDESKTAQSKFIEDTIKAELGDVKTKNGEDPIVMFKSKLSKKKPDMEGVYQPTLKHMLFGAPKKDTSDKEADFFEWKCPDCGTVNSDYVSTCKCGCTVQSAQNIAKGREVKEEIRENNPIRPKAEAEQNPVAKQNTEAVVEAVNPQVSASSENEMPAQSSENRFDNQEVDVHTQQEEVVQEPEIPDDYDPEMPDIIELTEEEIQAEIDEFMRQPVQVWRPQSQREANNGKKVQTEIYLVGNGDEDEEAEETSEMIEEKSEQASEINENEAVSKEEQTNSAEHEKKVTHHKPTEFDGNVSDTEWQCSICEAINPVENDTCTCGHKRGKKMMSYAEIINSTRKKPTKKAEEELVQKTETSVLESTQEYVAVEEAIADNTVSDSAEQKNKNSEEAKRRASEEAKKKAEESAKLKAEEGVMIRAEEEARRKAEEEARIKAEEEARRKAEEEARRKAEEEARRKAEEEARRKAEEEARRKAEEEARRKA